MRRVLGFSKVRKRSGLEFPMKARAVSASIAWLLCFCLTMPAVAQIRPADSVCSSFSGGLRLNDKHHAEHRLDGFESGQHYP